MGHGHVIPNADGSRAKCGGPAICAECAREAVQHGVAYPLLSPIAMEERGGVPPTRAGRLHAIADAAPPVEVFDVPNEVRIVEVDGSLWFDHGDGRRTQLTKSSLAVKHDAWECPRCHRINAPHALQCTCTGKEAG